MVRGILIDDLRVSVDVLHAGHQAAVVRDLPLLQKDLLNDGHEIHQPQSLAPVNQGRTQVNSSQWRPDIQITACGRLKKCLLQSLDWDIYVSIYLSIYLSMSLSFYLSIYLSIYLFVLSINGKKIDILILHIFFLIGNAYDPKKEHETTSLWPCTAHESCQETKNPPEHHLPCKEKEWTSTPQLGADRLASPQTGWRAGSSVCTRGALPCSSGWSQSLSQTWTSRWHFRHNWGIWATRAPLYPTMKHRQVASLTSGHRTHSLSTWTSQTLTQRGPRSRPYSAGPQVGVPGQSPHRHGSHPQHPTWTTQTTLRQRLPSQKGIVDRAWIDLDLELLLLMRFKCSCAHVSKSLHVETKLQISKTCTDFNIPQWQVSKFHYARLFEHIWIPPLALSLRQHSKNGSDRSLPGTVTYLGRAGTTDCSLTLPCWRALEKLLPDLALRRLGGLYQEVLIKVHDGLVGVDGVASPQTLENLVLAPGLQQHFGLWPCIPFQTGNISKNTHIKRCDMKVKR